MKFWTALSKLIPRKRAIPPGGPAPLSIVLLLRQPVELSETVLKHAAERAWEGQWDDSNFVVQEGRLILVRWRGETFGVLPSDRPWGEDPEKAAASIPELRRRKAWSEHRAWIVIDCLNADRLDQQARGTKLALAAQLASQLVNTNCTGIYFPHEGGVIVPEHESLRERLRTFRSIEGLGEGDPPVIQVDDAKWEAVAAEAKMRWPEFCDAFANRRPGETFFVKGLFKYDAAAEWMWIGVDAIESGEITGLLQNNPVNVRSVRVGEIVRIPADGIGDWQYTRDGVDRGGFSRRIFEQDSDGGTPSRNPNS